MKPVTTGIIVAFVAGMRIQVHQDDDIQQAFDSMANAVNEMKE